MNSEERIYILGCGAIGFPLAACLANAGRAVVAVRTSRQDVPNHTAAITVHSRDKTITASVGTVSLSRLTHLDGTIVVTAKAYANRALAQELQRRSATGPIVILQNGIGVEKPFLDAHLSPIYRCVLYFTAQAASDHDFIARAVAASPVGTIAGDTSALEECVRGLSTEDFPFRPEADIRREIWKKAIANAVFNSICPLLDADNGIFARDRRVAGLARELVGECVRLTDRLGLDLSETELIEQITRISGASDGQFISTLQDLKAGRQTEIEFLNLEMARVAALPENDLRLPKVELLGNMILAKSLLAQSLPR